MSVAGLSAEVWPIHVFSSVCVVADVGLLGVIELSLDPDTFSQPRPARPKRMEWRRDGRPGSRSARAPRRSHWFSYCHAVHGPKVRLKAASAQAVGLVLHELTIWRLTAPRGRQWSPWEMSQISRCEQQRGDRPCLARQSTDSEVAQNVRNWPCDTSNAGPNGGA
jgi:hypothetical protein